MHAVRHKLDPALKLFSFFEMLCSSLVVFVCELIEQWRTIGLLEPPLLSKSNDDEGPTKTPRWKDRWTICVRNIVNYMVIKIVFVNWELSRMEWGWAKSNEVELGSIIEPFGKAISLFVGTQINGYDLPPLFPLPPMSTSGWTTLMCRVKASLRENVFSSTHKWHRTLCLRLLWIVSSCRVRS